MSRVLAAAICLHLICLGITGDVSQAEIKLPSMFSNSMVLQRTEPVRVWGWTDKSEPITVEINGQSSTVEPAPEGRWEVSLQPMPAGGPFILVVKNGQDRIEIQDVMIGEVWLCSGQSNMAMTVTGVKDAATEIATAVHPQIRMFTVKSAHSTEAQDHCEGTWAVCTPTTVPQFSATAYFFGRRLHQELDVPIGLVNSSVGGTSIESWTSLSAQKEIPELQPRLKAWEDQDSAYSAEDAKSSFDKQLTAWEKHREEAEARGEKPRRRPQLAVQPRLDRNYPSNLFNGKIAPLVGYRIRGVIWYQGENSASKGFSHLYQHQLTTLIHDWRQRWGQESLPFAWVQLPNFRAQQEQPVENNGWVLVQDGMRHCLQIPNTGMAITLGLGEADDIHPRNKQEVGNRLAQWALASVYKRDLVPMGPIFREQKTDGKEVHLMFDYAGDGLKIDPQEPNGFAIAGSDRVFRWAHARVEGDRVIVWHDDTSEPVSVRYAWASNPRHSLVNSAGLPASPFRTDNWDDVMASESRVQP